MSKFDRVLEAVEEAMEEAGFEFPYVINEYEDSGEIVVSVNSYEIPKDTGYYMREIASVLECVNDAYVVDTEANEIVSITLKVDNEVDYEVPNMTLEIGEPVYESKPHDVFVIEVEIMHGDADHYSQKTFHAKTEKEAILLIDLFDRMEAAYPNGRGGGDNYDHLDGFELVAEEWPWDITSDYNTHGDMDGYEVYYYDKEGIKYLVNVKREGEV